MSVWWTKCNGRRTLFLQNFRNTAIYYSLHLQYIMYTQKIKLKEKAPNRPAFSGKLEALFIFTAYQQSWRLSAA